MPVLVTGIHVVPPRPIIPIKFVTIRWARRKALHNLLRCMCRLDVDARDKHGHDELVHEMSAEIVAAVLKTR